MEALLQVGWGETLCLEGFLRLFAMANGVLSIILGLLCIISPATKSTIYIKYCPSLLQGQRVELEHSRYFSSKRDKAIINDGGFLCQAWIPKNVALSHITPEKHYNQKLSALKPIPRPHYRY